MAKGITVMLDDNDSKSLRETVYSIITNEIDRARRDASLDKQYLRRREGAEFAGVSPSTFDSWYLPSHKIQGVVLYSKKDITEFIENH